MTQFNWNFTEGFHPTSKCWIYQSNRTLTDAEATEIEIGLKNFVTEWTAHKQELKATGKVLLNRFLVLMVDESLNLASGCSIDTLVKFIREVESNFQLSLLDRSVLLFEENNQLKEILLSELNQQIATGEIQSATFYFNNTVTTLDEMKSKWMIQAKDSWFADRFNNQLHKTSLV